MNRIIPFALLLIGCIGCETHPKQSTTGQKYSYSIREVFPCNNLNDIQYDKEGKMAVAVGDLGIIMRSLDGGSSWSKLTITNVEDNLHGVFIDDYTHYIWVVGDGMTAWVSKDNGIKWDQIHFDITTKQDINDVVVTDKGRSVWMVGANNLAIHSNDGGKTWENIETNMLYSTTDIFKVAFSRDGRNGWMAGESDCVVHTSDGGKTWSNLIEQNMIYKLNEQALHCIHINESDRKIYVAGDSGTVLEIPFDSRTPRIMKAPIKKNVGDIYFDSVEKNGWLLYLDTSIIYHTSDRGLTWAPVFAFPNPNKWFAKMDFTSAGRAIVAGTAGIFLYKGGIDSPFRSLDRYIRFGMEEVHSYNNEIIAVGWQGTIMKSTDAGRSWEQLRVNTTENLNTVRLPDACQVWVAGSNGLILHSSDTGKTWKEKRIAGVRETINTIEWADSGRALFAGTDKGKLYRSKDSGATWEKQVLSLPGSISDIHWYASQQKTWLVGGHGAVYTSSDLGSHWNFVERLDTTISFQTTVFDKSGKVGFISGNDPAKNRWFKGYRTLDGGKNWEKIEPGTNYDATDICMNSTGSLVFTATLRGNIYCSIDSGVHWFREGPRLAGAYQNCTLVNDSVFVATGPYGRLICSSRDKVYIPRIEEVYLKEEDGKIMPSVRLSGLNGDTAKVRVLIEVAGGLRDWAAKDGYDKFEISYDTIDRARTWPAEAFYDNKDYVFRIWVTDGLNVASTTVHKRFGLSIGQRILKILHWDKWPSDWDELCKAAAANIGLAALLYALVVLLLYMLIPIKFVFWHEAVANSRLPFPEKLSKVLVLNLIKSNRSLDAFVGFYKKRVLQDFEENDEVKSRSIWVPAPYEIDNKKYFPGSVNEVEVGLDTIKKQVGKERIVISIEGPGGIGKSSLAFQIARWASEENLPKRLLDRVAIPLFINKIDANMDDICIAKLEYITGRDKLSEGLADALLRQRRILAVVDGLSELQVKDDKFLDPENGAKKTKFLVYTSRKPFYPLQELTRIIPIGLKLDYLDQLMDAFTAAYIGAYWFADNREIIRLKIKMIIMEINKNAADRPVPLSILRFMIEKAASVVQENKSLDIDLPYTLAELFDSYIGDLFRNESDPENVRKGLRKACLIAVGLPFLLEENKTEGFSEKAVYRSTWVYKDMFTNYVTSTILDKLVASGVMYKKGDPEELQLKFTHDPIAEWLAAKETIFLFIKGQLDFSLAQRISECAQRADHSSFYFYLKFANNRQQGQFPLTTVAAAEPV